MKRVVIILALAVVCLSCAVTKVSLVAPNINPHRTGEHCTACHDKQPKEGEEPTFLFDGDITKICNRCHELDFDDMHPVDFEPEDTDYVSVPNEFPLLNGILTCSTCHDFTNHTKKDPPSKKENPKFLRGAPYESKNDLCWKCHEEPRGPTSIHEQLDLNGEIIEDKCLFCHTAVLDVNVAGIGLDMFYEGNINLCTGCHQDEGKGHPAKVNHLDIKLPERMTRCLNKMTSSQKGVRLPLFEDKMYCTTCHNPHQKGVLKGAAGAGAGEPFMLRVPEKDEICIACHCKEAP